MKFLNKSFWLWRFHIGVVIVDLFVRDANELDKVYPIFVIDILKPHKGGIGISFAIPVMKISIGFK